MEVFWGSVFKDIVKNAIMELPEKAIAILRECREYDGFLNDIESWCDDFIKKNESTIVASLVFLIT